MCGDDPADDAGRCSYPDHGSIAAPIGRPLLRLTCPPSQPILPLRKGDHDASSRSCTRRRHCPGAAIPSIAQTTAPATKPVAQATAPATQPVHIAKKGKLSVEIAGDGTLQPAEPFEVRLKFKSYAGPLTVVSAAQHQSAVRKGDVLLACEKTQYTWAMEQATNELALARANQQKAVADADVAAKSEALTLRVAEDGLKNAETSLKWWKDTEGPQMLQLADLTVTQYRNSVEDQGDELDQLKKMYNKEDLTKATADIVIKRALRRFDISKIHLKMQEDHCRKTKDVDYGIANQRVLDSVEVARQQLTSTQIAQAQLTVARKLSLANARIAVEQAQRKFEELQSDAALLDITAPADGMVVYAQVGDWQAGAHGYKAGDKPTPGAAGDAAVHAGPAGARGQRCRESGPVDHAWHEGDRDARLAAVGQL